MWSLTYVTTNRFLSGSAKCGKLKTAGAGKMPVFRSRADALTRISQTFCATLQTP